MNDVSQTRMSSESVEAHYTVANLTGTIFAALERMGKNLDALTPLDLAPVDEFHTRGREATVELAHRAGLSMGLQVLDVGCGIGGSARYLAAEHQCRVTGVDLTQTYCDVASVLAERVGLADRVRFKQASALDIPFDDDTFDVVWTEHAQMNIADKRGFYGQIARVLRPGGRFVFHDIFQGIDADLAYPVPWAGERSISFLASAEQAQEILEDLGLTILQWEDRSETSLQWMQDKVATVKAEGPMPLGLHLLMGETALIKLENYIANLREQGIAVFQGIAAAPTR